MQQHRVETQILHEDQILEAIDQLRRRKARPDADRICNYLLRKFSVDARDTIADLHRLIEAEKVIQVDYKGNTSYRNASKWSRLQLYKNRPEGFVKEKLNSSMIAGAVAELVVEEPDYLDQGVPAYRLVEQLLDGVSNPTSRRMVEDFLSKEVASGNIARLSNGNYSLVATTDITTTSSTSVVETNATTSIADTTSSVISMSNSNNAAFSASAHQQNNNHHNNNNNNNNHQSNNNNNNNNNIGEREEETTRDSGNNRCSENGNSGKLSYSVTTTPIIVATPPIITTTTIPITTTIRSQETTSTTSLTRRKSKSPELSRELYDFEDNEDEVMVTDSRSNTPRSSQGNLSPARQLINDDNNVNDNGRNKNVNKEECYEITIIGKEPDSPEESVTKDDLETRGEDSINSNSDTRIKKQDTKQTKDSSHSNLKKTSKSERKQRLLVRSEDPMDIEIKFEDYRRESKDDRDKQQQRDLDNGQQSDERDDDDYAGRSSTNPSPTPSNTTVAAFRSARRKRAKKVFDPSDNNVVKRKRGRPVSQNKIQGSQESQDSNKSITKEGPNRQCSLCAKEKSESLVACRDCTVRAHPTCIYPPDELLQKSGSSWQCERCKSCTVCCETSDVGPLITCYTCDEAYHYSCHVPRIPSAKSNSKWQCNDCTQKNYKSNVVHNSNISVSRPETPSNPPVLPPVLSPQVSPNRASSEQMDDEPGTTDGIDPNIPDASDWTSEQVYQYFARLFPKEAEVFRVQDIDGHSLLLMKRSDVLSGLDLLLGPALKIYRHVLKLQMRRDDPRLYWL